MGGDRVNEFHYVDIVFENVESIRVRADRLVRLDVGPQKENGVTAYGEGTSYSTDSLHMAISFEDEAVLAYDPNTEPHPAGMYTSNPLSNVVHERPAVLGRILHYRDIVNLTFLDEQEQAFKTVYVPWREEDEYSNKYMEVEAGSGVIEVKIEKD